MTGLFEVGEARRAGRSRRGSLRAALRRLIADPAAEAARRGRLSRFGEVCAVLDDARGIVERGWAQDRWLVRAAGAGRQPGGAGERPVVGACVVGAVVQALRRRNPAATVFDAGLAVDLLWDAWHEMRGSGGPGVAGRAAPAAVREARVRDLARWNDDPGRRRNDVLRLIDLATARAIMAAVADER